MFDKIANIVIAEIKRQWDEKGHSLTGKAQKSLVSEIKEDGSKVTIDIIGLRYIEYMSRGIKPENIPFGGTGTGKETSDYIDGLRKYAELRVGITDEKKKTSFAFAVARKHKLHGNPLRFNNKGSQVLAETAEKVSDQITKIVNDEITAITTKTIRDTWQLQ